MNKGMGFVNNNSSLENAFNELKTVIENNLSDKQKGNMEQWLKTWKIYIEREKNFKPHLNIKYNPGDIVSVCYGYNVGSEQGGNRPSVVLEDNDLSDKTVMVVPLASLKPDETEEGVHFKNVYLGELTEFNTASRKPSGTRSKVLIHQMRTISKQRIIRPTKEEHTVINIGEDNLKLVYAKIKELYTTKF